MSHKRREKAGLPLRKLLFLVAFEVSYISAVFSPSSYCQVFSYLRELTAQLNSTAQKIKGKTERKIAQGDLAPDCPSTRGPIQFFLLLTIPAPVSHLFWLF